VRFKGDCPLCRGPDDIYHRGVEFSNCESSNDGLFSEWQEFPDREPFGVEKVFVVFQAKRFSVAFPFCPERDAEMLLNGEEKVSTVIASDTQVALKLGVWPDGLLIRHLRPTANEGG
jgi:hypothetical protein